MKFWKRRADREEVKRKMIAKKAAAQIAQLATVKYPIAMLFDRQCHVCREPGEGWPAAYAREFRVDLPGLRDLAENILETGTYLGNVPNPTERDLRDYFTGFAALAWATEQELASERR